MIDSLITSKTRIKLLVKFFLNPNNMAYLRELESEFGESSNAIRLELNRLEEAQMLEAKMNGKKKIFKVNQAHPLYSEINSIVRKYFGLDVIVESVIDKLGEVEAIYLTGELAKGRNTGIIDLIFLGEINRQYLSKATEKVEELIKRKIRYLVYEQHEWESCAERESSVLLWKGSVK